MIPKDCRRLAEVDFPIAEVSKHAAREKSIRHGHPSTLHLWWARRPLASSRAVLLALLWPDPCDPLCPAAFKAQAKQRLREVPDCNPGDTDEDLRQALLRFIAHFSNWDNATQSTYLEVSRELVKAAHTAEEGGAYEPPLVVDPFSGGGSIPLEALRLGCEAFASDTNPIAVLILKTMLEAVPNGGPELAPRIRAVGAAIREDFCRAVGEYYPPDPDGAQPVAYLWARTIRCEAPRCGVEFPLARSFWLSRKSHAGVAVRFRQARTTALTVEVFTPRQDSDVPPGTTRQGKATCPVCTSTMTPDRVKAQLRGQHGGANVVFDEHGRRIGGTVLLAVVTTDDSGDAKRYRASTPRDYAVLSQAVRVVDRADPARLPSEPLPYPPHSAGERREANYSFIPIRLYGLRGWIDVFAKRQQLALMTLCDRITAIPDPTERRIMAMVLGRCVDYWSASAMWANEGEFVAHTFGRQALPMVWDFAEAVPTGSGSGSLANSIDWVARVVERLAVIRRAGQVEVADAAAHPLPDGAASVWFTDPPYYDAVPYSYLSDFFLVWQKRALGDALTLIGGHLSSDGLTDKRSEIISELEMLRGVDKSRAASLGYLVKDRVTFERMMGEAFREGARVVGGDGVGSVVFAHKTTEGWEALLSGLIRGGWVITGSWPIATERPGRLRAKDSAALATSVHLICRPRTGEATVGDWADILRALPTRVTEWMERLQHEGVRGADLVFACIGPALEIFSRFSRVETAEGREVKLDEYLAKVWEVVGRAALAQVLGTAEATARNGAAGALEEDARLTALFLWTFQATDGEAVESGSSRDEGDDATVDDDDEEDGDSGRKAKGFTLIFDVVRRFAQPLGIELPKWEGRVVETKKGVVRLLPVAERAQQLFGEDGAGAVATRLEQAPVIGTNPLQGMLFPEMEASPRPQRGRGRGRTTAVNVSDESLAAAREATTLDRVHAAMLLQASGRTNALRALLRAEQDRGPEFLRLGNALSALYPKGSEEKRLLDAMLVALPR